MKSHIALLAGACAIYAGVVLAADDFPISTSIVVYIDSNSNTTFAPLPLSLDSTKIVISKEAYGLKWGKESNPHSSAESAFFVRNKLSIDGNALLASNVKADVVVGIPKLCLIAYQEKCLIAGTKLTVE